MALFNQTPFAGFTGGVDSYAPSQDPQTYNHAMARTLRIAGAQLPTKIHPVIGQEFQGPIDSPLQRIVLPPRILPSGTV